RQPDGGGKETRHQPANIASETQGIATSRLSGSSFRLLQKPIFVSQLFADGSSPRNGTETAKAYCIRTGLTWKSLRSVTRNRRSVMKIARIAWHIARPPIFSMGGTNGELWISPKGRRVMRRWPAAAPVWAL